MGVWTEENIAILKAGAANGWSASQIAEPLGITRNAVIGKLHRLGLAPGRPPPSLKRTDGRPVVHRKSAARIVAEAKRKEMRLSYHGNCFEMTDVKKLPVSIDDDLKIPLAQRRLFHELREEHCRWIVGDPTGKDWFYCGGQRLKGQPYCAGHCRLAYAPPQERRRALA